MPRHSGSLLAVYEVQGGDWKGFGIGGGVRGVGERPGDAAGSGFVLPAYIAADALAYYRYENMRFGSQRREHLQHGLLRELAERVPRLPGLPTAHHGSFTVRF